MTTFLQPDEAGIESRTKRGQNKRGQNRAACFLHLRDLVYFVSLAGFWLVATALVLDMKKAQ